MIGEAMETLETYREHLETIGLSRLTVQVYCADLAAFRRWFLSTRDEAFGPDQITPAT